MRNWLTRLQTLRSPKPAGGKLEIQSESEVLTARRADGLSSHLKVTGLKLKKS